MKLIRMILGSIILFFDRLFSPKPLMRAPQEQERVDQETASMSLYQFQSCPFCVKVRRSIKRLNLKIDLKDARNDKKFEAELLQGGGKRQVPCLRIQKGGASDQWMYESSDIISFLESRFSITKF